MACYDFALQPVQALSATWLPGYAGLTPCLSPFQLSGYQLSGLQLSGLQLSGLERRLMTP